MATIRVNHSFWNYGNTYGNTYGSLFASGSSYLTSLNDRLDIYQGTMPSWSTFTDASTRSSDLLVSFTLNATSSWSTSNATNSFRVQVAITGNEATASQSGIASWFMLRNYYTNSNDLTNRGALIGTVGITGTGADLEIPDTSIVNGTGYRSSSFYINFPLEFTF